MFTSQKASLQWGGFHAVLLKVKGFMIRWADDQVSTTAYRLIVLAITTHSQGWGVFNKTDDTSSSSQRLFSSMINHGMDGCFPTA